MTNSKKHKNKIPIPKESTWSRVKSWMNTLLAYYGFTLAISALISMRLQFYLLEHYGVVHDAVVLPERITQHTWPELLCRFEYKSNSYKTSSYISDTAENRIGEHLPIVFLEDYPYVSKPVFIFDKDIKFHTEGTVVQYTAFSKFLLGFVEFTDALSFGMF